MKELTYFFTSQRRGISISPFESDSLVNLAHMDHLVGTLFKNGETGKPEPYLAREWIVSSDFREWSFEFRQGLSCEDGSPITPIGYKLSIEKLLRSYYQRRNRVPIWEKLVGFDNYLQGGQLEGIEADQNVLRFRFIKPVKSGLIDFLSMPFFGYYCAANFIGDDWASDDSIVSSGSYKLLEFEPGSTTVVLEKRPDWFSHNENSPDRVTITQCDIHKARQAEAKNKIISTYFADELDKTENSSVVVGVPEILIAMVLSPASSSFKDVQVRRCAAAKFRSILRRTESFLGSDPHSEFFYPYFPTELSPVQPSPDKISAPQECLRVLLSDHLSEPQANYMRRVLNEVFSESVLEFMQLDKGERDWVQKYTSDDLYDIRIIGVRVGDTFKNWLTELMFCSSLGVSFPDPSSRICELVRDYEDSQMNLNEYAKRFNQVLYEDAAVIPIFHRGLNWILSGNISRNFSMNQAVQRFDLLKVRTDFL